jgi:uncharacterized oxidoreductase
VASEDDSGAIACHDVTGGAEPGPRAGETVVAPESLRAFAHALLDAFGAPEDIAAEVARHLVDANLCGHDSHGVARLLDYRRQIDGGVLIPGARPSLASVRGATALVDGHWGFGQWSARFAMTWALEAAGRHGVAAAAVRHAGHAGRMGDFVELAADAGLIGIITLGLAGPGAGIVAPFAAAGRFFNTNPWAVGIPASGRPPMIMDFATSAIAEGKARVARAKGVMVPPGTIRDAAGAPATDPEALYRGGSLVGLGGEVAGHKGQGLAIAAALLGGLAMIGDDDPSPAGAMTAGAASSDPWIAGVLAMALDPACFGDPAVHRDLAGRVLDALSGLEPAAGHDRVMAPGEPEARSRAARTRTGIPIPGATWAELSDLARRSGVDLPG